MTEEVEQQEVDIATFLTALVKHVGPTEVPIRVFDGLSEGDLLAIELDPARQVVQFALVDPDTVTLDE